MPDTKITCCLHDAWDIHRDTFSPVEAEIAQLLLIAAMLNFCCVWTSKTTDATSQLQKAIREAC